jgi:hypothetical protein
MPDYIPDSFENRFLWFRNLHDRLPDFAGQLGWTPAQVSAFQASLAPHIARLQAILDAEAALDAAIGAEKTAFADNDEALRGKINEIKAAPGFDDGIGQALKIFTTGGRPAPADIKPTLKAEAQMGHVRLTGRKDYAETVNLYMRRKGATAWTLIGPKRKRFPFDDQTPLATPGTPEQREYFAHGVIGDDEVGQPSDIVPATFAG